jgi:hypothetical protein
VSGYPYPLADWRDASAYPGELADLPWMSEWAWEFLRRNPEYQAGFDQMLRSVANADRGPGNALCDRFHVQPAPPDPRGPWPAWAVFSDAWTADSVPPWAVDLVADDWAGERARHGRDLDRVAFVFDLRWPLETQLERVRLELLDAREQRRAGPLSDVFPLEPKRPRKVPHGGELARYLRILDAAAAGVTLADMVPVLLPTDANPAPDYPAAKKLRGNLKAARALCGGGYFELLL